MRICFKKQFFIYFDLKKLEQKIFFKNKPVDITDEHVQTQFSTSSTQLSDLYLFHTRPFECQLRNYVSIRVTLKRGSN